MLVLIATGCATPLAYQPDIPGAPSSGGYTSVAIDALHHRIRVSAAHGTKQKVLRDHAMRRAAEIARQNGYYGFKLSRSAFVDHAYVGGDKFGRVRITYEPGYDDWTTYWRYYRHALGLGDMDTEPTWLLGGGPHRALRRVEYVIEIELRRAPDNDVFDAAAVIKITKPIVRQAQR